ncbi:MAG: polynucleotide kinase-phosphatase [Thermoguttaceae bacterium]|jgi:protein phosphatase|nr:polynucleotide kinase-phosphatase [Thermoguttaceae bacterium]
MQIEVPNLSLIVLIGPSGSGKSTFASKHFLPTEVLSSDACRGMVCDDENDQAATNQAFELLHFIARQRLALGRLTVVDATNVQPEARRPLVQLAREWHCIPVGIVFNLPEKVCQERNRGREDRSFGPHVIRQQRSQLRRSLRGLKREGFSHVFILGSPEEVEAATIRRTRLWNDRRDDHGPFDVIGDVHGCCDELEKLLQKLGYVPAERTDGDPVWGSRLYRHPAGRKAVFLGDIVDRGPRILDTLRLVRNMVADDCALCVPGNHDMKLLRKLTGRKVQVTYGLAESLAEIEALPDEIRREFVRQGAEFLDSLVSHYVLDGGRLVVAHAGMKEEMQGRGSGKVRGFALYGETTGETDEFGLPVRYNWAAEYRGQATVVYGHTPVPQPEWLNRTTNIDTGCVFGGKLTAFRWPEREFVAVPAARTYCESARPFLPEQRDTSALSSQQLHDDLLDAEDVLGKRIISTRLRSSVTIREENAVAALEIMSRFAANPKWLIYLPPTMSPCETSDRDGFLEYPNEAFAYYRSRGVLQVVCEEKHMGSRAVVVVCRDEEVAVRRFGVAGGEAGIVCTRTGRRFFPNGDLETALLARLRAALDAAGFWTQFSTDWACFDCELMPWSAKAQELLRSQYAAVGASGRASLPKAVATLRRAAERLAGHGRPSTDAGQSAYTSDVDGLLLRYDHRGEAIQRFVEAYRHYCWPVRSLDDLKLAPFHLMATEGKVHVDQSHVWHMESLAAICRHGPALLVATPFRIVDLADPESEARGIEWWLELTGRGGEGMVVKPHQFISAGAKGLVQPAVKCRGCEYLRIIYGPEYAFEENLSRLRKRGLATKRSLALREFALGIEALERFVRREPLRRVHECVFGVLALESEPVDPRL